MVSRPSPTTLPRAFYERDPTEVAPQLLNKILLREDGRVGRIAEVEAYRGSDDPAAHTFRGKTRRNQTMFGEAGHLYVYFTYGRHFCCNAVCGAAGQGWGVLIRAVVPVCGVGMMREARPKVVRDADLASGPGRLTQAFGINRDLDGADLVLNDRGVWLEDDGTAPPSSPVGEPRVGISRAQDFPWRWRLPSRQ